MENAMMMSTATATDKTEESRNPKFCLKLAKLEDMNTPTETSTAPANPTSDREQHKYATHDIPVTRFMRNMKNDCEDGSSVSLSKSKTAIAYSNLNHHVDECTQQSGQNEAWVSPQSFDVSEEYYRVIIDDMQYAACMKEIKQPNRCSN
jgi:hypothetical protein